MNESAFFSTCKRLVSSLLKEVGLPTVEKKPSAENLSVDQKTSDYFSLQSPVISCHFCNCGEPQPVND